MAVHNYGDGVYFALAGMDKLKPGRRHQTVKIGFEIFTLSPLHRFLGALLAAYCVAVALGSREVHDGD